MHVTSCGHASPLQIGFTWNYAIVYCLAINTIKIVLCLYHMKLSEQKTIKILTPLSASSNAHRLLSVREEEKLLLHRSWGGAKKRQKTKK
jgi:hypothetical protein